MECQVQMLILVWTGSGRFYCELISLDFARLLFNSIVSRSVNVLAYQEMITRRNTLGDYTCYWSSAGTNHSSTFC